MKFRTFVKNFFLIIGLGGVGAVIHQYTGLCSGWERTAGVLDAFLIMFYVGSRLVGRVVGRVVPRFFSKSYEELVEELK